ncbi:hypothetical protein POTOM_016548 [Populus tomentosa]|uniref:Uncharacterized protein n=1 Tax=Populus tomentosa TaxID=118781 RepID=A0A8X7ZXA2_POPTO|nr:hypothetical protein POTOM_016548 [Populus tomentosa]
MDGSSIFKESWLMFSSLSLLLTGIVKVREEGIWPQDLHTERVESSVHGQNLQDPQSGGIGSRKCVVPDGAQAGHDAGFLYRVSHKLAWEHSSQNLSLQFAYGKDCYSKRQEFCTISS